jgi:hypothetical protein
LRSCRRATDPDVSGGDFFGPDGPSGGRGWPVKVEYSRTARDEELAGRLWELSEELTGVAYPALVNH